MRVVVIGLDGATWDLIKPWAESGKLPTFKKLMETGSWGHLKSTIPPVTGPAWVSFATGKNPGKHGIFDFVYLKDGRLKLHTSKDIKAKPFYEFLSKKGLKNIIISLPLSFPPQGELSGIMISDFLYPDKGIFPPDKKHYLEGLRLMPDLTKESKVQVLNEILTTLNDRIHLAKSLFISEDWDFYFVWIGETDSVSHHFWSELLDRNSELHDGAFKVFRISDEFLGWILENMDNEDILFLMSDHGFGTYPYVVHLNKILRERGYVKVQLKKFGEDETLGKIIVEHGEKSKKILKIPKWMYKFATVPGIKNVSRFIYRSLFRSRPLGVSESIDFQSSIAFVPTSESWSIYLNVNDTQEREKIRNELINLLNKLEFNGKKIFKRVFTREEIYSGPFVDSAPDILFLTNGFFVDAAVSPNALVEPFKPGSFHELYGIFLAYGRGIKKGQKIEKAKIYDIAPTILHIFGLPIPNDVDGRVLMEIFEEDSEFAKREPKYVDPSYYEEKGEDEKLKKAIKNLKLKGKI